MPQVRLLIFYLLYHILTGAKQNSWFPGTGLPVEVKRRVHVEVVLYANRVKFLSVWYSHDMNIHSLYYGTVSIII